MKLIRLQSGSLACVYQDEDADQTPQRDGSGVYRAFSGSVEAAGASESEALASLDRSLLSLSSPPGAPDLAESDSEDVLLAASHDTDHCPSRFRSILPPASCNAQDTVRAPRADTVRAPASLPARAFAATH